MPKKNIFVFYIEDDENDIVRVRASLVNFDIELATSNFDEALTQLNGLTERLPDLILLDLANDHTGSVVQATDIIGALAKHQVFKKIPILCYSNKFISPGDFQNKELPYAPLGNCYQTSKRYVGHVLDRIIRDILTHPTVPTRITP